MPSMMVGKQDPIRRKERPMIKGTAKSLIALAACGAAALALSGFASAQTPPRIGGCPILLKIGSVGSGKNIRITITPVPLCSKALPLH